jgi:hypothetical protein
VEDLRHVIRLFKSPLIDFFDSEKSLVYEKKKLGRGLWHYPPLSRIATIKP